MKKKTRIYIALCVSIVALYVSAIFVAHPLKTYLAFKLPHNIYTKSIAQPYSFNIHTTPIALGAFPHSTEGQATHIAMTFKVDKFALQDLFQTANVNQGIRAELSKQNHLSVLVGKTLSRQFVALSISKPLIKNAWYDLSLSVQNDTIQLHLHRHTAVYTPGLDNANQALTPIEPFHYALSHITVGQGFNKARVFHGTISTFSITQTLYSKTWHALWVWFFRLALLLSILALLASTVRLWREWLSNKQNLVL